MAEIFDRPPSTPGTTTSWAPYALAVIIAIAILVAVAYWWW